MLGYAIATALGGVVGWMAKARSCGTTAQNGGGGTGNLALDACDANVKAFIAKLDPVSATALQNAIASANNAVLEQFAFIVQPTNPQLATCLRNLKKA